MGETEHAPASDTEGVGSAGAATTEPVSLGGAPPSFLRWMTIATVAGLAAGVTSWGAGELVYDTFKTPLTRVAVGTIVSMQATTADTNKSDAKNATLAFFILGSVLGLFLGAAGGLVRRDPLRSAVAGVAGLVFGGFAATLVSLPLLAVYYRGLVPDPNDMLLPLLVLGGIWSATGAVAGLAFGLGAGAPRRMLNAATGAFLGVVLATILYEVIGITWFPDAQPTDPIPKTWVIRLMARVMVATLAAAGAAAVTWDRRSHPSK